MIDENIINNRGEKGNANEQIICDFHDSNFSPISLDIPPDVRLACGRTCLG